MSGIWTIIWALFTVLLQKILSNENEASNCCINSVSLEKQCLSCLFFAKESVEHLSL